MINSQLSTSATTTIPKSPTQTVPPPDKTSNQKTFLARINHCNRQLGLFLGVIIGTVLGIILVQRRKITIAIIGVPDSGIWEVLAICLAAGTGGNVGSFVGAWFDIVFGPWTVFDGMKALYLKLKRQPHESPGSQPQLNN